MKSHSRGREAVTEAIILKVKTINENDIWVDFLTPEDGRLWGVARHGRKSYKRFGAVLESANHVRIRYKDKGGVVHLEEAQLMESARGYPEYDLSAFSTSFFVIDLVREFVPERNRDPNIYALIKKVIVEIPFLKRGERIPFLEEFEREFLSLCGYGVQFDHCASCQKPVKDETQRFYFVYREGALFCQDCAQGHGDAVLYQSQKLIQLIPRFLEYQLSHPLRSRKVLTGLGISD